MTYRINEVFNSIQGEGGRTGTANVFVRFAGCNLTCNEVEHGFDCDTEFSGGMTFTLDDLVGKIRAVDKWDCRAIVWTGGEPTLQLDEVLLAELPGYHHAIETNGTKPIPGGIQWVTVSPKTAEHTLRCERATELKYVRAADQALPRPVLKADYYYLSPRFFPDGEPDIEAVRWCQKLVLENPKWRLSLQTHKLLSPVR